MVNANKSINYTQKLDDLINIVSLCANDDEIFKELAFIDGGENKYFISTYGNVVSLCRNNPILLTPFECNGYLHIEIAGRNYKIHRLVAQAFIPNPDNKPVVHHKNHRKWDNHVDNLVWATHQENTEAYIQYVKGYGEKVLYSVLS